MTVPRTSALLALAASIVVAQEVLLTRLLSVTTWYGLAFVVINLAMVGLTAGSLRAARAERNGEALAPFLARHFLFLAASLLAASIATALTPIAFKARIEAILPIVAIVILNTIPMIAGGAVIARLMAGGGAPVPVLYAIDLVAAAFGAVVPLVLLGPLTGPGAMIVLPIVAAAGAWIASPSTVRWWPVAIVVAATGALAVTETRSDLVMWHAKGRAIDYGRPVAERWSALGYVAVTPTYNDLAPSLWAPSPAFKPQGRYASTRIHIDGDAWTPVHADPDVSTLTFLRYDAVTSAHRLRPRGTACVIGVGGGRDVLSALHFGHERVLGIEINPDILELARAAAPRSPLNGDPRVELVVGDGRAVLSRRDVRCSVLQASLIDTFAATSAGAFAHTEATLYSREAWSLFLDRVEPDGIVTFSRWYAPGRVSETVRLVSLAVASLLDRGVKNPRDHIAMITSTHCATLMVSPTPFSPKDRAALLALERELRLPLVITPGRDALDPVLREIVSAPDVQTLADRGAGSALDTSAPTDDRPFFFQILAPKAWLHPGTVRMLMAKGSAGVIPGNITAMIGMVSLMTTVALLGVVLLGPTIVRSLREQPAALPGAWPWVYFGALGAGFMLTEIALVQRMHVVLGHPTYALVVILAGLLVATGIGSAASTRVVRSRRAVSIAAIVAAVVLATLPALVISPLARMTTQSSLGVRIFWTAGCAGLVGFVLGMFFPSGLRFTNRRNGAPAALAINGITSVLGGGAAVLVSVLFGIPATFALAAGFYLLAAVSGPSRWERTDG